jgi:hypothetical protein
MAPFLLAAKGFGPFNLQANLIPEFTLGEPDKELEYNLALSYSYQGVFHPIAEINGETVFGGHDKGDDVVNGTAGILCGPFSTRAFEEVLLGLGVQIPITEREDFDENVIFTLRFEF